jgi:hypothetical protein
MRPFAAICCRWVRAGTDMGGTPRTDDPAHGGGQRCKSMCTAARPARCKPDAALSIFVLGSLIISRQSAIQPSNRTSADSTPNIPIGNPIGPVIRPVQKLTLGWSSRHEVVVAEQRVVDPSLCISLSAVFLAIFLRRRPGGCRRRCRIRSLYTPTGQTRTPSIRSTPAPPAPKGSDARGNQ